MPKEKRQPPVGLPHRWALIIVAATGAATAAGLVGGLLAAVPTAIAVIGLLHTILE